MQIQSGSPLAPSTAFLAFLVGLSCSTAMTMAQPHSPASVPATQPGLVVLTPEALRVHREGLLIDGHNDLAWRIRKVAHSSFDELDIGKPQPKLQVDIPRMRQGGIGAQFWAVYVPPETEHDGTARKVALEEFDLIDRMNQRYADTFELARTADDIERIHHAGKIASLIGIEGGYVIENSLDNLDMFYRRGARYLGLTHSMTTDWADSATDEARHGGLTPFGEKVVLECNRLGMLVDLAHTSPDTMRDAIRVSRAPVIVSHAMTYAVAKHARNVPDDVLQMIAAKHGIVMISFFSGYLHPAGAAAMADMFQQERAIKAAHADPAEAEKALRTWKDAHPIPPGTVGDVVAHIDHIVKLCGVDYIGLGSDYEGAGKWPLQMEDVTGYPYITQELLNRGYTPADVHKIMGGNFLRVLRAAEQVARDWK